MPRLLSTGTWQRDSLAVIVGIRLSTGAVERIWVQRDGGLLYRGVVHYPRRGRTAVGEAMTKFGLLKFRRFSASQAAKATAYAAWLALELGPDDDTP